MKQNDFSTPGLELRIRHGLQTLHLHIGDIPPRVCAAQYDHVPVERMIPIQVHANQDAWLGLSSFQQVEEEDRCACWWLK